MHVPARESERPATAATRTPATRRPAGRGGGSPARAALALQRAVGNRAAAGVLSRWMKHPDSEKKGVMVPDVVAAEYDRFNPPQNA